MTPVETHLAARRLKRTRSLLIIALSQHVSGEKVDELSLKLNVHGLKACVCVCVAKNEENSNCLTKLSCVNH